MSVAKNLILLLLVCAVVSGCDRQKSSANTEASDDVKLATQGDYSLMLPKYLSSTKALNDEASLQYQNPVKEVYIVVIDDIKAAVDSAIVANGLSDTYTPDYDGYTRMIRDRFLESVELQGGSDAAFKTMKTTSGHEMKYFEAEAKIENMDIFYLFGMVGHDDKYYQIVTWTMRSRREKYTPDMLGMLKSFTAK